MPKDESHASSKLEDQAKMDCQIDAMYSSAPRMMIIDIGELPTDLFLHTLALNT